MRMISLHTTSTCEIHDVSMLSPSHIVDSRNEYSCVNPVYMRDPDLGGWTLLVVVRLETQTCNADAAADGSRRFGSRHAGYRGSN